MRHNLAPRLISATASLAFSIHGRPWFLSDSPAEALLRISSRGTETGAQFKRDGVPPTLVPCLSGASLCAFSHIHWVYFHFPSVITLVPFPLPLLTTGVSKHEGGGGKGGANAFNKSEPKNRATFYEHGWEVGEIHTGGSTRSCEERTQEVQVTCNWLQVTTRAVRS